MEQTTQYERKVKQIKKQTRAINLPGRWRICFYRNPEINQGRSPTQL